MTQYYLVNQLFDTVVGMVILVDGFPEIDFVFISGFQLLFKYEVVCI